MEVNFRVSIPFRDFRWMNPDMHESETSYHCFHPLSGF